jgi:sodium transport system permease protein
MNWKDIRTLYVREVRSALRERVIVVNSILIPVVLYPLLMWLVFTAFTYVSGQTAGMNSRVALLRLPPAHRPLRTALSLDPDIQVVSSENPEEDIRSGALDLVIEFVAVQGAPQLEEGNVGARITYDASRDQSATAHGRVRSVIERYRDRFIQREAEDLGVSPAELEGFRVEERNISTGREMGRFILGLLLPILLIIMFAIGAVYPAIDTTAGERENGTWETLMAAATSRSSILVAKYLYVATMSFVAGCLNVIAMTFTMRSSLIPIGQRQGLFFEIPLESIPVLAVGAALLALLASAGMMILAAFARTFREGQSLVSPFFMLFLLPMAFIQGPAQEFTARVAFIPVINVALMFREAISGSFNWPLIGITIAVEAVCIAAALRLAAAILRHEDFVLGSYNGSFLKFVRQRLLRPASADAGGPGAR